jgi:hypothetical protein
MGPVQKDHNEHIRKCPGGEVGFEERREGWCGGVKEIEREARECIW